MGKVTGSSNKESGTNSYAKNNQSAIKALKTVGKAIAKGTIIGNVVGSLVGAAKEKRTDKFQEKAKKEKKTDKYQEKAKKEIEAVDV